MQTGHGKNSVYTKEKKLERELQSEIHCGRCPYNKGENANRRPKSDKYKSRRKGR